jgi:GTP pyrophosphokinase
MFNKENKKINQLISRIKENGCGAKDQKNIEKACYLAQSIFGDQKRASGNLQIEHAVAVADLLIEWRMTPEIIIAGILHDILEYSIVTKEQIKKEFGHKILKLIIGESLLDSLKYSGEDKYAENLRRMFLAMAKDVQIIFIKFADRIDNLKTLEFLPKEKQERMAKESLEIYAPIAGRLGMEKIKQELEDLSFKHLDPEEYEWVKKISEEHIEKNKEMIKKIIETINIDAKKLKIKIINIKNRQKNLYALYCKLLRYEKNINKIFDFFVVRITVEDIPSCYALLGLIHGHLKPLPRRIKDYIAQPKPNGYRSLHTNVFSRSAVIEFQIRTPEMEEEAEYGIAAHWLYQEKKLCDKKTINKRTAWMKELALIQKDLKEKRELDNVMNSVKIDLFHNRIFIFTPKGDVIDLPEDATPLDYAYALHADLGNHYKQATVNGMPVNIDYKLRSNDVVEVKSDEKKTVHKKWLKFVATRRAKKLIKDGLKNK